MSDRPDGLVCTCAPRRNVCPGCKTWARQHPSGNAKVFAALECLKDMKREAVPVHIIRRVHDLLRLGLPLTEIAWMTDLSYAKVRELSRMEPEKTVG